MIDRVERCQHLTWDIGEQVLTKKRNVVLDLGFMTKALREYFIDKAKLIGASAEVHYLNAPINIRKQHVTKRNSEKDRSVYSIDVTDQMFEFMEPRFESASEDVMIDGKQLNSSNMSNLGHAESRLLSDINNTSALEITVGLCRLVIGITRLNWFIYGNRLNISVAIIALLLTVLPMRFIGHSLLRNSSTVVISLLLAAHILLGMQFELYETSKLYDKSMHLIGSAAIAGILIVAMHTYCERYRIKLPLVLFAILASAGTLSLGTLWELFEFGVDSTGLFNAQRGLHDTMIDLLADAIGAVLATSMFVTMSWRQKLLQKRRIWDHHIDDTSDY